MSGTHARTSHYQRPAPSAGGNARCKRTRGNAGGNSIAGRSGSISAVLLRVSLAFRSRFPLSRAFCVQGLG
eukprot:1036571-Rhodomonas_salina.2